MPFRFSIRAILLFVTTVCAGLVFYVYWTNAHEQGLASDYRIIAGGKCDIAEYQAGILLGPFPTQAQRITKLHFNIDLHWYATDHITYYNKLPYVDTISFNGEGALISDRVAGALEAFPQLETVVIQGARPGRGDDWHYDGNKYHSTIVLKNRGITVVLN